MTTKRLYVLAIPLALAACSGRSGAEDAVRAMLKDPESARFGDFYYNNKTRKACLTVNAKNSMGGYTGDRQVRLRKEDGSWTYETEEEESPDFCRKYFADES